MFREAGDRPRDYRGADCLRGYGISSLGAMGKPAHGTGNADESFLVTPIPRQLPRPPLIRCLSLVDEKTVRAWGTFRACGTRRQLP